MDPITIGAAVGGIGKALGGLLGRGKEKRIRATALRWSPYSNQPVPERPKGDFFSDLIQGVGVGATGGQKIGGLLGLGATKQLNQAPKLSEQVASVDVGAQLPKGVAMLAKPGLSQQVGNVDVAKQLATPTLSIPPNQSSPPMAQMPMAGGMTGPMPPQSPWYLMQSRPMGK